jgi:hypothetical protein
VKGLIVDAGEPQISELLAEFPELPAMVIAERPQNDPPGAIGCRARGSDCTSG